jgi:alkanesulfonate monooxygenase SsuD/methylene tetrahydromethanopterin reductase-like flavin-dependent oxidoreductase (luciferase family)
VSKERAATRRSSGQAAGLPIGVQLGSVGSTAEWWLASARRLDEAGYRGLWCWDHFMGRGEPTVPVLEQWTLLAAAAGVTERIGLGTFITNVMNRHPGVIARMAATVQAISHGRLTLGIGIGGFPGEHVAYGMPYPSIDERVARLEEGVAAIRALWTGGPVSREGRFYPLRNAHAHPTPDPLPRILLGAGSKRGVQLAARIGDGWAAEQREFEKFGPAFLEALAREGRARTDVWIALGFGGGRTGQDALRGSPWIAEPRDEWQRWHAEGADEVVLTARTTADVDALVEAVARW